MARYNEAVQTWRQMSLDSRAAAKELLVAERFRSSISRAYYAAYCAVTDALAGRITFGYGGNNPTHNELPNLIVSNLSGVSVGERHKVRKSVRVLQAMRAEADYVPAVSIGRQEARNALREADRVLRLLGVEDE